MNMNNRQEILHLLSYMLDPMDMDNEVMDGILDQYWNRRLSFGFDHEYALRVVLEDVEQAVTSSKHVLVDMGSHATYKDNASLFRLPASPASSRRTDVLPAVLAGHR
ncbi:MAG: hypothetical protein M1832_004675 [Thelocarpon impressellum]|nr:MAG: hypothetical protein M1832_004675 [Thelocarpon impressellum]